jgi:phosphoserine phosphatase
VTATNNFVTRPIVSAFGIDHLIATELEVIGDSITGHFSGKVVGIPNFREGKVTRVNDWLSQQGLSWSALTESYFYSDSINDLPLMEKVSIAKPTNPDESLRKKALENNWPVLELFK